jgi:HEPN domain-containing protein
MLSLQDAQDLTRLNIETRYPMGDAEDAPYELFGPGQAERAIGIAQRVLGMAEAALEAP